MDGVEDMRCVSDRGLGGGVRWDDEERVRCRDGGVKGGEIPRGGSSVHICNEKIVIHVPA